MKTIGAYEAKTHLSRLLDEVAKGKTITITKHGVPVAVLTPPPGVQRPDVATAIAAWRRYGREHNITTGGIPIREMIEEGRRW